METLKNTCAFDSKLHKLKEINVEVHDAILSCKLLKNHNLSDIQFQLTILTTEMTFNNIRWTLKKLFAKSNGIVVAPKSDCAKILVKNEPDMEAKGLHNRHNCGQY